MKYALMILSTVLTLSISAVQAEPAYDIVVNYCIKKDVVLSASEMLEAMAFLTYSENQSNECTGSSHIEFVNSSNYKPDEFIGQVGVLVKANCAEAQSRLFARINQDQRFVEGSMGWCLH